MQSIIFLGLSLNQLEYIQAAKNLGFHIIGFDGNFNAECRNLCDVSFTEKINNHETIINILKNYDNLIGCVSEQTDNGLITLGEINSFFNLCGPSLETVRLIKDKSLQRVKSQELNINQPEFISYNLSNNFLDKDNKEFIQKNKKIIIKPFEGQSSIGVIARENKELLNCDINSLFNNLSNISGSNNFLIEQFIEGEDISIEGFVYQSDIYILAICTKTKFEDNPMVDKILKVFPYIKSIHFLEFQLAEKLIRGFRLDNSFFHIEAKKSNDSLSLIEWSPRGCGARLSSILLSKLYKTDLAKIRIDILKGNKIMPKFQNLNKIGLLQFFNYEINDLDYFHKNINEYTKDYILYTNNEHHKKKIDLTDGRNRMGNIIAIASRNEIQCISNFIDK
tara:strand:- start:4729 stop:5907 length:1179 start_codon:yes stop_codon:yes gene_type:complete